MGKLVIALAVLALTAAAWRGRAPVVVLGPEASFRATNGPAVITVAGAGELESAGEHQVSPVGVSGQIEEIVAEGSHVKKGDVVARLATFAFEEQELTARREVSKKQAEMKRTLRENATSAAEDQRKITEKSEELDYNRRVQAFLEGGPDKRTVDALSLKIDRAKLEDAALARRLEVQEALKNRGYLSELDYESIKTDLEKSRLERAKQENLLADRRDGPRPEERKRSHLQVDRYGLDLDLARDNATSQETLRKLALSKKEAETRDRQAAVDEKAKLRARAVIRAPVAGTVIYGEHARRGQPIGVGAEVYPSMVMMKLVQRGTMHAKLDVPERWLDRVQVGQAVTVTAAGRPREHAGRVAAVARLATAKDDDPKSVRMFEVVVKLDSDDPVLKPNMSCEARIQIAAHARVARLPVDLVRGREKDQVRLLARRGLAKTDLTAKLVDEDFDFVYVTGIADGEVLLY